MGGFSNAAVVAFVLLLAIGTASSAKVQMKAADCNLLTLKSDWTKVKSCKSLPSCTVYNPAVNFDDQYEGPTTILCNKDGYVQYMYMGSSEDPNTGEPHYLTGTLPNAWYKLSKVETIFIDSSDLEGTLPAYWGYMNNLKSLTITSSTGRSSMMRGGIPKHWGAFKNLESLAITDLDTLSGKLPSELGLLKKLTSLALGGNSFSGILPASLGRLSSLQYLYLGDNKFIGDPAAVLGKLTKTLLELDLSGNGFSGRLPVTLANAKKLQKINFQDCKFSGRLPSEWGALTSLSELNVQSNKGLVGAFPASWSKLPRLGTLYIGGTGIRGSMATFKNYSYIFMYIYPETQMCGDITEGRYVSLWNFGPKVTKLPKCK